MRSRDDHISTTLYLGKLVDMSNYINPSCLQGNQVTLEMAAKVRLTNMDQRADRCPVVGAIRAVVTESRLLVVRHLFTGPKRFNELLRESQINSKTLSATLKFLEDHGIVRRDVVSTKPFNVQYSLTQSGLELGPALEGLGTWGRKWLNEFNAPEPRTQLARMQKRSRR